MTQRSHQEPREQKSSVPKSRNLNNTLFTLSNAIALYIAIIILAGPNEPSLRLDHIRHHIIDQPMLIPYLLRLELLFVLFVIYPFEDVLEPSIVLLQDSVLGGEVKRVIPLQREPETALRELLDALIGVVHGESNASLSLEIVDLHSFLLAALALEDHLEGSRFIHSEICGLVLIPKCVSSDDNRRFPAWNESRDVFDEYRLSKDSAIEDIPDGSVRALPHLLQIELLNASLIGRNGGTLDAYFVFLDCLGRINRNLVIRGITVLNAQIEIFDFQVEEGQNELVLDGLPNDPSHLVAVHLHHWIGYLYLLCLHYYYTMV